MPSLANQQSKEANLKSNYRVLGASQTFTSEYNQAIKKLTPPLGVNFDGAAKKFNNPAGVGRPRLDSDFFNE